MTTRVFEPYTRITGKDTGNFRRQKIPVLQDAQSVEDKTFFVNEQERKRVLRECDTFSVK